MQIFVKLPNSGTLSIDVKSTDSVEELRATVYAKYAGAHPDLQTLAFQGRVLEDGKTLADYGLALESELQLGVRPASQTIELCVGGRDYITTLDTLLSKPGSYIYSIFEDVRQGGVPSFRTVGAAGPDGVLEGVPRHCATGPLPQRPNGVFFLDRHATSFEYVLNYLRSGGSVALPTEPPQLQQLAIEARFFGLDDLADACTAAMPVGPIKSFETLVAACRVLKSDILALSEAQLSELLTQQDVNVALAVRIRKEMDQERERARKEQEAETARIAALAEEERAVEMLRSEIRQMEADLSEDGVRALAARGLALRQVCELDAAAAREIGLSAEDARIVDALLPVALARGELLVLGDEAVCTDKQALQLYHVRGYVVHALPAQGITIAAVCMKWESPPEQSAHIGRARQVAFQGSGWAPHEELGEEWYMSRFEPPVVLQISDLIEVKANVPQALYYKQIDTAHKHIGETGLVVESSGNQTQVGAHKANSWHLCMQIEVH